MRRIEDVARVIVRRNGEEFKNEGVIYADIVALRKFAISKFVDELAFAGAVEVGDLGDQRVGAYRILWGYRRLVQARPDGKEVPVAKRPTAVLEFEREGDRIGGVNDICTDGLDRELRMF